MPNNLITILGPTASGKTALATSLAYELKTEIISGDSRQVFKGLNIGSGKDLEEYQLEGVAIPYHLIDILEANKHFSVYHFQQEFDKVFRSLIQKDKLPILCGGSGLYIEAVLQGFEYTSIPPNASLRAKLADQNLKILEEIHQKLTGNYVANEIALSQKQLTRAIEIQTFLSSNDWEKPNYLRVNPIVFGIDLPAEIRREKIKKRLQVRLRNGMIEEVEGLIINGVSSERLRFFGLEYKFVVDYLEGISSFEAMEEQLFYAICQFSKRQMTYFRKMEKDGIKINWLDGQLPKKDLIDMMITHIKKA